MAYYAKVIAGFLCLAHFAGKAYNYMLGEETWKIMPLLRPFALLLVIMFWGGYCDLVRLAGSPVGRNGVCADLRQEPGNRTAGFRTVGTD